MRLLARREYLLERRHAALQFVRQARKQRGYSQGFAYLPNTVRDYDKSTYVACAMLRDVLYWAA
jgi:hypothetical protein